MMAFRRSWTFPSPGNNNLEPESINHLHRRKDYGEDKQIYGKKTLSSPDDVRTFDKGKVELATVGTVTFGGASLEPGWKWSESVKPIAKTEYCEAPHVQYHISGRLRVRMVNGDEQEFGPGDVGVVPSGHDAWVVGNEPVVVIDISGMTHYAKPAARKVVKKSAQAKRGKKKKR